MNAPLRKKILFVITKSNWGGAQRYVFDLSMNLPKEEFEVAVAFGQRGFLAEELEKAGIKTFALTFMQRNISWRADWHGLWELVDLFKKEKPDIVHLNSSKAGGIGALAGRIAGVKKIIFTAHGWPFWEERSGIGRAFIWLFSWLTALLSHKIIVVSNYDLSVAEKMPFVRNKVVRIYNGITPTVLALKDKVRGAFPAGVKIIGTIGELNKNKNQQELIERAKNDPTMYVAIVGEGEERSSLEEKIKKYGLKERVKLFGFMPASEVLGGIDIFTLTSTKEGLPYVLLEAKAQGLPIEANRVGGVGEILDAKDMSEFSLERMVEKTIALYR